LRSIALLAGAGWQALASTWGGAPLAALVARIATMPPEKPASLPEEQRVDLLTYVLCTTVLMLRSEPPSCGAG
jgi:hypothetical protein